MNHFRHLAVAVAGGAMLTAACAFSAPAFAAGPEVVAGPASDPQCFVPVDGQDQVLQVAGQEGPLSASRSPTDIIANTWRIQMIQTAKAYAAQPDIAAKLKEFKVVSTGEDVAAQIAAINNFIDSGFDAIVVNAQNPAAFKPVIKRANDAGVVLVAFDNILDTEDAINVNVDQKGLGVYWAQWLASHLPMAARFSKCAASPAPRSISDRHDGIHETLDATGKKWDVVEVYGKWDDPTAQKVTADAIAVQKHFDGITAQGGDTGVVQAMLDAKHPMVPFGGETENGFRKFCAQALRPGTEVLVRRHRAGAGRGRDQGRARRPRGAGRAAVGQAAAGDRRRSELQGRRELLRQPVRQFLRRQFLPHLQHQFHRAGNHGADRRKTSSRRQPRPPGQRSSAAAAGPARRGPVARS